MFIESGEVLSHRRYGAHYHSLTVVAEEIGARVRPGQFVNVRCGVDSANILRRPFSVYRVHKQRGWASTVEIVFDVHGPGTQYLSQMEPHDELDLFGPAGNGFVLPKEPASCLLVGGGIGAAPLFLLADELRAAGHRVDIVLGARTADLLLNAIDARRLATSLEVTTEDGSAGHKGRVTDILVDMMGRAKTDVVFTCGPHPMLAAVSHICLGEGVPVQVAVEELMACGYGVCMTCVIPVRNRSGGVYYSRSCTDGPIFPGEAIAWNGDAVTPASSDRVGAAAGTGGVVMRDRPTEHPPPGN